MISLKVAVLSAAFTFLTVAVARAEEGGGGEGGGGNEWQKVDSTIFPDGLIKLGINEGLCNDGTNFFLTFKDQIHLASSNDLSILYSFVDAIPHELRSEHGYNHLGDCQYHSGMLYFAVEEPTFTKPAFFAYKVNGSINKPGDTNNSNNNSSYSIEFFDFYPQLVQSHMPWVARDPTSGVFYSSEYSNTSQLEMYVLEEKEEDTATIQQPAGVSTTTTTTATTIRHTGSLKLVRQSGKDGRVPMVLDQVQGGAFFDSAEIDVGDGMLYIGVNHADTIYKVDPRTGVVEVAIVQQQQQKKEKENENEAKTADGLQNGQGRRQVQEYEMEGVTFLDLRDSGNGLLHNTANHIYPAQLMHCDLL